MKKGIHPKLNTVTAKCACGYEFETLTTLERIYTDTCAKCHPFFTGQEKFMDAEGRIDKFNRMRAKATQTSKTKETTKTENNNDSQYKPTLKDIFNQSSN